MKHFCYKKKINYSCKIVFCDLPGWI